MTNHGNVAITVGAVKPGAVGFTEELFRTQPSIDRIVEAIKQRAARARRTKIAVRFSLLTRCERHVVEVVDTGVTGEQVAAQLDVSTQATHSHGGRTLRRSKVHSVARPALLSYTVRYNRAANAAVAKTNGVLG